LDVEHGDEAACGLDVGGFVVCGDVEAAAGGGEALGPRVCGEEGAPGTRDGWVVGLGACFVCRGRVHHALVLEGLENGGPFLVGREAETEHVSWPPSSPALRLKSECSGAGREPVTGHETGGYAVVVDPGEDVDVGAVAAGGDGDGDALGGERV